jgi:hypothetical protein
MNENEPGPGGPIVRVSGPARATRGHVVSIQLTEEQSTALEKLTGERLDELNMMVEDLEDIADLMTN